MFRTFLKWSRDRHIITQEPEEKHVTKVIVLLDKLSQPFSAGSLVSRPVCGNLLDAGFDFRTSGTCAPLPVSRTGCSTILDRRTSRFLFKSAPSKIAGFADLVT